MRDKFNRFMQGRYGVDAFARFTMGVALVAIILSIFFRSGSRMGALLDTVGLLVLLYTYYRMLSRDIQKRYQENEKYLAATAKLRQRFNREKSMMNQRKTRPNSMSGWLIGYTRGRDNSSSSPSLCRLKLLNDRGEAVVFLGDGVPVYREALKELLKVPYRFAPAHVNRQRAAAVAALGLLYAADGKFETATEHCPDYLRLSQAERERVEREAKAQKGEY